MSYVFRVICVPVWMILYQDANAVANGSVSYALINAADGTLIDALFR